MGKKTYQFEYFTAYDKSIFYCEAESLTEARKLVPKHLDLITTGELSHQYHFDSFKRRFKGWSLPELETFFGKKLQYYDKENKRGKITLDHTDENIIRFGGIKTLSILFTYTTTPYFEVKDFYDWEEETYDR